MTIISFSRPIRCLDDLKSLFDLIAGNAEIGAARRWIGQDAKGIDHDAPIATLR